MCLLWQYNVISIERKGKFMKIYSVKDKKFAQFGRVLDLNTDEIVAVADKIEKPAEGSVYEASRADFEALAIKDEIQDAYFGTMDTQLGYCYGHSHQLNALEWHTCSEVNIAIDDLILLLGDRRDIEEGNRYNSANVKAFRLCRGEAIEVYATTLHFCPIETDAKGFGCVVGLLKGTNLPLEKEASDPLLFRVNKWIFAHDDNKALLERGVVAGIYGENYKL